MKLFEVNKNIDAVLVQRNICCDYPGALIYLNLLKKNNLIAQDKNNKYTKVA